MLRIAIGCCLFAMTTVCLAQTPIGQLPQPHYHPKPSDPAWLGYAVQLHGHLGPWVVAGARLGMAGARAVDAKGHFDAEVTCEGPFVKPPERCFLDGVQIGTGATLGKRTIHYVKSKEIVLKVKNPQTGKSVEVRPSKKLMDLLVAPVPKQNDGQSIDKKAEQAREEEYVEQLSRDIVVMPDAELLTISNP